MIRRLLRLLRSREFRRYLITGISAFAVEYLLYLILYRGLRIDYALASVIVYFAVFSATFVATRSWTFESSGHVGRQLAMHLTLFLFNLVAGSYYLVRLLVAGGVPPEIAPILKMGMITCWNFLLYKYVIYRK